jgi:hypothetical protein
MKLTAQLKLFPTSEQASALRWCAQSRHAACNAISFARANAVELWDRARLAQLVTGTSQTKPGTRGASCATCGVGSTPSVQRFGCLPFSVSQHINLVLE